MKWKGAGVMKYTNRCFFSNAIVAPKKNVPTLGLIPRRKSPKTFLLYYILKLCWFKTVIKCFAA